MFERTLSIADADAKDLVELARLAGEDPLYFYWDADFMGVDIRGQNLEGMDLSRASFEGVLADAGTKVDRRFRPEVFRAVLRSRDADWHSMIPEELVDHAVIVARAGYPKEAAKILDALMRMDEALPHHSSAVIRCEEIDRKARNAYYKKWARTHWDNPAVATTWALIAHDKTIDEARSDLVEFIDRFLKADLSLYEIYNAVESIVGMQVTTQRAALTVLRWVDYNRSYPALEALYNYMFHFNVWASAPMAEAFSEFVRANVGNRRIGPLIAKGGVFFGGGSLFFVEVQTEWLIRNLRAAGSKDVLANILSSSPDARLGSIFLRWTRVNGWLPDENDFLFQAARRYEKRVGLVISKRTLSHLRKRLDTAYSRNESADSAVVRR